MAPRLLLTCVMVALGSALPGAAMAVAPAASPAPYSETDADDDLKVVLTERGRTYVDARGRLEAHPELTSAAATRALRALAQERSAALAGGAGERDPALGRIDARRARVFALLGDRVGPEGVAIIAAQLRESILAGSDAEGWRQLLLGAGAAGVDATAKLVADTAVDRTWRARLLEDLVTSVPASRVVSLADRLGSGARDLERTLRRAIVRRARADRGAREALRPHLERLAAEGPSARRAAALLVSAEILPPRGDALTTRVEYAGDEALDVTVRIAALHSLARRPTDTPGLRTLTARLVDEVAAAGANATQSAELLASFALDALPSEAAATLMNDSRLRASASPRVAARAWSGATLDPDETERWLADGLEHAWPEVRVEVLRRVERCPAPVERRLSRSAGPQSRGGEPEPRVARAAIVALGRCGAHDALVTLVDETGIGFEQRGMAARALAESSADGAELVAQRLKGADARLAEPLATALAHSTAPGDLVRRALCQATTHEVAAVARAASHSSRELFGREACE